MDSFSVFFTHMTIFALWVFCFKKIRVGIAEYRAYDRQAREGGDDDVA